MGILKDNYNSFLNDIEKNIKNKEDLEYVKGRAIEFFDVVLEKMDSILKSKEEKISTLENKQSALEDKMNKLNSIIDKIEKDIYVEDDLENEEDEDFDFEVVCPYCDYEFAIDMNEYKNEVECPNCMGIIDLEWEGELDDEPQGCSGSCSTCCGCGQDDEDDEDDEDDDM